MSYYLLAFRPGAAPEDRADFVAWFAQVVRLRDGHLSADPTQTWAPLAAWQRDMNREFSTRARRPIGAPVDPDDEIMPADYRFGADIVYARLDWRLSRKAQLVALKLARTHMVGLFEAGGERASVWSVTGGVFQLAHRGEAVLPGAMRA